MTARGAIANFWRALTRSTPAWRGAARPSLTLLAATRRCTVHDQTYTAACPSCRADEDAEEESA